MDFTKKLSLTALTLATAASLSFGQTKEEAMKMYPQVVSMIDKLAKRNQFHKNKANNLKSKLMIHINKLGAAVTEK